MSKRDFEAIARILANYHADVIDRMARELADYFATRNPAFNRSRFLAACGIDPRRA